MGLEIVRIDALRCLSQVEVRLHPQQNYLYGANGAGKTSFLEGIYLLSRGRSFRTRQTRRLIQRGADSLFAYGELRGAGGELRRVGVRLEGAGLVISIDREGSGLAELARLLQVDVIDPSIHRLIEGGPSERRRFLDWGVFHVEHGFLAAWRRYRRVLSQRNAALKRGDRGSLLRVWDDAFLEAASTVNDARLRYVSALSPVVDAVSQQLLRLPLNVAYLPGWREGVGLVEALAASFPRDLQTGFTQVGPHRADLRVELGQELLADRASRGQQKLAAAALVIAQVRVLDSDGATGLMLIDDPAAELDSGALSRLLAAVAETNAQKVFTGLTEDQLRPEPGYPVFHVEQGRLEQVV